MDQSLCVAYVLWRFPVLSHTFVASEILALRQMGVRVLVFSLLGARDTVRSASSQKVCAKDMYYSRLISPAIIASQAQALVANPFGYAQALSAIMDVREMGGAIVARAMALFPKCVAIGMMCKRIGVSHLHAHWQGLPVFGAQVAASIRGVPFSFSMHSLRDANYPGLGKQVRRASFVRYNSRRGQQMLVTRFPEMTHKLKMVRTVNPGNLRELAITDGGYMLAVGRLTAVKGLTYLIQACSLLHMRGVNCRCVVIGDGPLRADLIREAISLGLENRVEFMGALPHERVLEYVARCSFLVAPSVQGPDIDEVNEGLPTVIIEAMSAGKPVIATDAGAISELVVDERTGLLVPQRDVDRLADALERLILHSELRRALGENALMLAQAEFDNQEVARQLLDLFRDHSVQSI